MTFAAVVQMIVECGDGQINLTNEHVSKATVVGVGLFAPCRLNNALTFIRLLEKQVLETWAMGKLS